MLYSVEEPPAPVSLRPYHASYIFEVLTKQKKVLLFKVVYSSEKCLTASEKVPERENPSEVI